jgi:tetratricopeptide (TPR) repeat protein
MVLNECREDGMTIEAFFVPTVAPKIRLRDYLPHARWCVLLAVCTLFMGTPAVSLAAQIDHVCSDAERIFAKVEGRLEKTDDREAVALLRGLGSCPNLSQVQRFNVGWLYGKVHDFDSALRIFASLPPAVPDRLTHAYAIALGQFELGHYQEAIDTLTALRATGTFDAKCADLLGVSYSKLSQYQSAYEVMVQNLDQFPSDPYPYLNLMTLFVDTGELEKAAQVANRAVASLPQSAEVFTMRGSIELSQGESEKAYHDFAVAARLSPKSADPPFFMALSDYRLSKFSEAVQVLRSAIASGIADSDLHYLLAECLARIDGSDSKVVLSELNRAIQLNPQSASARTLRGQRLLESGHPREAVVDLKIVRKIEPGSVRDTRNATYLLARAYLALGMRDEAKALFDQVGSRFSPASAEALNQLSDQKMRIALHP